MAYQKVPRPSTVYHLTQKGNLDRILDDGRIRRFSDTECWFCESLDTMRAYMEQTVMCKGKTYRTADGQLCHYSNFNPEAHILLKLAPIRQEDAWYRRTQDQPSSSSDEMMQEEREFFPLSIGYRGDMAFQNAEVIDVPKFLAGGIVSHKELTSNELWGLIFERTEAEMAAYMRGLDHLERDELIQSAAEISAIGATNYSQKTIYLSEASATLHEFGHFLDWTLGIPAEHEQLYLAEAQNSGLRDYAKTNAREYFADCFDYWIAYSGSEKRMETFRNAAPQTWAYFEALEKNNWRS